MLKIRLRKPGLETLEERNSPAVDLSLVQVINLDTQADNEPTGFIDELHSQILYQSTLTAGSLVRLECQSERFGNLDPFIRVFDKDLKEILKNDNAVVGTRDSLIEFVPSETGIYYFGISNSENQFYAPAKPNSGVPGNSSGDYLFREIVVPNDPDKFQITERIKDGLSLHGQDEGTFPVTLSNPLEGGNSPDIQTFSVELDPNQGLRLLSQEEMNHPEISLRVYDHLGNSFPIGRNEESWELIAPYKGAFYFAISGNFPVSFNPNQRYFFNKNTSSINLNYSFEKFEIESNQSIFLTKGMIGTIPVQGISIRGNLREYSSVKSFVYVAHRDENLFIRQDSGSINTVIRVFDQSGLQLGYSDSSSGFSPAVSVSLTQGQRIFLAVSGKGNVHFNPGAPGGWMGLEKGDFQLYLETWATTTDFSPFDNDIGTAKSLINSLDLIKSGIDNFKTDFITSKIQSNIVNGNKEVFKINVYHEGYLEAGLINSPGFDGSLELKVFSTTGEILKVVKSRSEPVPIQQQLLPGIYYLEIGRTAGTPHVDVPFSATFAFANKFTLENVSRDSGLIHLFRMGDANGDGLDDLIVYNGLQLQVYRGDSAGLFSKIQDCPCPEKLTGIEFRKVEDGRVGFLILTGVNDHYLLKWIDGGPFALVAKSSQMFSEEIETLIPIFDDSETLFFLAIGRSSGKSYLCKVDGYFFNVIDEVNYDKKPTFIKSSPDGKFIYLTVDGVNKLFKINIDNQKAKYSEFIDIPYHDCEFSILDLDNDKKDDFVFVKFNLKNIVELKSKNNYSFEQNSISENLTDFGEIRNRSGTAKGLIFTNGIFSYLNGDLLSRYFVSLYGLIITDVPGFGSAIVGLDRLGGNLVPLPLAADGKINPDRSATVPIFTSEIRSTDINNDGFLDLVSMGVLEDRLILNQGFGDGSFSSPREILLSGKVRHFEVSDFNRDGVVDIVAAVSRSLAGNTGSSLEILLGRGDGTFVNYSDRATTTRVNPLGIFQVVDVDGDGNTDILFLEEFEPGDSIKNYKVDPRKIYFYRALGDGVFEPASELKIDRPQEFFANKEIVQFDFSLAGFSGGPELNLILTPGNLKAIPGSFLINYLGKNNEFRFTNSLKISGQRFNSKSKIQFVYKNLSFLQLSEGSLARGKLGKNLDEVQVVDLSIGQVVDFHPIDLNQDSDLDLATIRRVDGKGFVSLLVNGGNDRFSLVQDVDIGSFNTDTLAIGDFNGDKIQDFALNHFLGNRLSILFGKKSALFVPGEKVQVSDRTFGITAGDWNGDGFNDLAAAVGSLENNENFISISLGGGNGSFEDPQLIPVGRFPFAVGHGDFDGDGLQDIVTTNRFGNSISVILGKKDGQFEESVRIPLGRNTKFLEPASLFVTDMDGDGVVDILVGNYRDNSFSILFNRGQSVFQESEPVPSGSVEPLAVVSIDLNHDGLKDVLVANRGSSSLSVLLKNPDGSFFRSQEIPVGFTPTEMGVSDGGSDNNPFVVLTNQGSGSVEIFKWSKEGMVYRFQVLTMPGAASVILEDFNSDSRIDIGVASPRTGNIGVSFGLESGFFSEIQKQGFGVFPNGITAGDFNQDGRPDIGVTQTSESAYQVLININGFQVGGLTDLKIFTGKRVPLRGDMNFDGIDDFLVLDQFGNLLFRQGIQSFGSFEFLPPILLNPQDPFRDFAFVANGDQNGIVGLTFAGQMKVIDWANRTTGFRKREEAVKVEVFGLPSGQNFEPTSVEFVSGTSQLILVDSIHNLFGVSQGLGPVTLDSVLGDSLSFSVFLSGLGPNFFQSTMIGGNESSFAFLNSISGSVALLEKQSSSLVMELLEFSRETRGLTVINQRQMVDAGNQFGPFLSFQFGARSGFYIFNQIKREFSFFYRDSSGSLVEDPDSLLVISAGVLQVQAFRFSGDENISLCLLLDDGRVVVYRNIGSVGQRVIETLVDKDSVAMDMGRNGSMDGFAVFNQFGDFKFYNFNLNQNQFNLDKTNFSLTGSSLLSGKNGKVSSFVFDQKNDTLISFNKVKNQFLQSFMIDLNDGGLSGPIDAQFVSLENGSNTFLVVANSLGNSLSIFRSEGERQFQFYYSVAVGTNPVSITVVDINFDKTPDLLVSNKGSNDVSVLVGKGERNDWVLEPFQRLKSGGFGPIKAELQPSAKGNGPDIKIINSDGNQSLIPGIGSGGVGSGFFLNDPRKIIETVDQLDLFPVQTVSFQGNDYFLDLTGKVTIFRGNEPFLSFGSGIRTFTVVGEKLFAGIEGGQIGVFSLDGANFAPPRKLVEGEIDSLNAFLENGVIQVSGTEKGVLNPFLFDFGNFFLVIPRVIPVSSLTFSTTELVSASLVLVGTVNLGTATGYRIVEDPQEDQEFSENPAEDLSDTETAEVASESDSVSTEDEEKNTENIVTPESVESIQKAIEDLLENSVPETNRDSGEAPNELEGAGSPLPSTVMDTQDGIVGASVIVTNECQFVYKDNQCIIDKVNWFSGYGLFFKDLFGYVYIIGLLFVQYNQENRIRFVIGNSKTNDGLDNV